MNWFQCFRVHGNFHGPFGYRIFELVSMLWATCTTWKFPCTILVKFLILLVSPLQGTWKFPWTMDPFGLECLNYSSFNVTRYMEISMYPFGQEFLNWSQCHRVHGNFHGPFRYRIFELASMARATCTTWIFPCTLLDNNF